MDAWSASVVALALVLAHGWVQTAPPGENCRIPNTEIFHYGGREYILFFETLTWDEAEAFCNTYQGELVNVQNRIIANFLTEMIAESNKRISEVWIGGRRVKSAWVWSQSNVLIGEKPDKDGFPPWVYTPKGSGKACLALDRRNHDGPAFVDLDCLASRSFICERSKDLTSQDEPQLARTARAGSRVFYIYRGRLDWHSAVTLCRKMGKRLAVVPDEKVVFALSQAMTKARPDVNTAWIGGKYTFGSWKWVSTGEEISDVTDPLTLFPPWRNNTKTHRNHGCVLLDRRLCDEGLFADVKCQKTRDFICEDSGSSVTDATRKPPLSERFIYKNKTLVLDLHNVTWEEGNIICKEMGGHLVHVEDQAMLEVIIDLMAEPQKVARVTHLWAGGEVVNNTWKWSGTDTVIPLPGVKGYPPWCDVEVHPDMPCLNIDRAEYNRPAFYGLECNNTQPFICEIDCMDPLRIQHGTWHCSKALSSTVRNCNVECKKGYVIHGNDNFYCSLSGWKDLLGHSVSPQCLSKLVYNSLLIDKLRVQTQQENITSLLFLLEDSQYVSEVTLQGLLQVVANIVRAIPSVCFRLSDTLRAGLLTYGEKWAEVMGMQSANSCSFTQGLPAIANMRMSEDTSFERVLAGVRQQIETFDPRGRTAIIVLGASDAGFYTRTDHKLEALKRAGHVFYCVALNLTSSTSVPSLTSSHLVYRVASLGPDESYNAFIYNSAEELDELITEIARRGEKLPKECGGIKDEAPINITEIPTTTSGNSSDTIEYTTTTDMSFESNGENNHTSESTITQTYTENIAGYNHTSETTTTQTYTENMGDNHTSESSTTQPRSEINGGVGDKIGHPISPKHGQSNLNNKTGSISTNNWEKINQLG